jgi:ubiquinone/menaquinone biosynthesis C-methylase UbiE
MSLRAREYYEHLGGEAVIANTGFDCSEPTVRNAVIAMATRHLQEFDTVLDVCCGANLIYDAVLAKERKRVFGIDFSFNFLRLAPRDVGVTLTQGSALELPFRDSSFDAAVCSEAAEHIADDSGVVSEIARILKPKGLLFFTVPNLWNASRIIEMVKARDFAIRFMEGHVREYSPRQVRKLLQPWFRVEARLPVPFGWTGPLGGKIDWLVERGILRRFSKSIAMIARKR